MYAGYMIIGKQILLCLFADQFSTHRNSNNPPHSQQVPDANNTANFTIPEVLTFIDEDEGSENDKITVELLLGGENFTLLRADPEGNAGLERKINHYLSGAKMTLCLLIQVIC